jgi:hypothetical protein
VAALLVARTLSWAARLLVRRIAATAMVRQPSRQLAVRPAAEPQTEVIQPGFEGGYTLATVTLAHRYAAPLSAAPARPARRRRWLLLFP